MLKTQFFIAAALLCGVAIGYFARTDHEEVRSSGRQEAGVPAALFSDKGGEASIAALRARIADLERRLSERGESVAERKVEVAGEPGRGIGAVPERRGPPTAAEMRERMAKMEREDPVRFAHMTNHFARMRAARRERAVMKMDFLSSIDTSGMDEFAKKTHLDLQDRIARRDELEERMHDMDLSDEERAAVFAEMRENEHALRELNLAERDNLLAQTAAAIGLSPEDSVELTETIKDIVEATEGGFGMRGRGGPPPPHPPGAPSR